MQLLLESIQGKHYNNNLLKLKEINLILKVYIFKTKIYYSSQQNDLKQQLKDLINPKDYFKQYNSHLIIKKKSIISKDISHIRSF